jgi:hypothetical protein
VIGGIKALKDDTYKVCTSDNAANMLAAIPNMTDQINAGLGCIDHQLNLIVNKTIDENTSVSSAVAAFKTLSARVHRSSLDQQRIKKECAKTKNDPESDQGKIVNI